MIKYYLIQFIRNCKKDIGTSLINIFGLSIGLACALLIFIWINDEFKMDKFHENDRRLYQAVSIYHDNDIKEFYEETPALLAETMANELPEIEFAVPVIPTNWFDNKGVISKDDIYFKANEQFVGKDYFKIFSYDLIDGNTNYLFRDNRSILISDEIAIKLFKTSENLIGKTINWNRNNKYSGVYSISGVFKKPQAYSTTQFDVLFSYDLFFEKEKIDYGLTNWLNVYPYTYLTIKEETNITEFNYKIRDFIKLKNNESKDELFVRPYSDKYLFNKYKDGKLAGGRIAYVRLFSSLAFFILIIACVNFMNLATAKASIQLKKVGVKKTLGAKRKSLITEYIGETMMLTFIALLIAVALAYILLPVFNVITGKELKLLFTKDFILAALGITFFTGLFSGSYPAFYISGLKPVNILKKKFTNSTKELNTRKGLVVFQFAISLILIVFVVVVYKQFSFIQSKDLGFKEDNVITFSREGQLESRMNAFMSELTGVTGVCNATNTYNNLTTDHGLTSGLTYGDWNVNERIELASMSVGYDFFKTLGIAVVQGRSFSRQMSTESSKIIFNEAAIKLMGIKAPIGKMITLWGDKMEIIGVVKDFHFESLYEELKPSFFRFRENGENILVRIESGDELATILNIKKLYEEFNPGLSFEYRYIDNDIQALYEAENKLTILSKYFSGIALILSCLGLFGLAAYTTQKRFKEIGIRKVHGSSELGVVKLISTDFVKQVMIAIIIAIPISNILVSNWLSEFAYRIELKWWIYAGCGLLTLIIAIMTVGTQALKAAQINPVECLRDE